MGSGVSILDYSSKVKGDESFNRGDFYEAISWYSRAIDEYTTHLGRESDIVNCHGASVLFCNRSAAYFSINECGKALDDAIRAIECQPSWAEGYFRAGQVQRFEKI